MAVPDPEPPTTSSRLLSIDALRGFDMFWIIGGDRFLRALARQLGPEVSRAVDRQLEHAAWEGFRFYDLIFPLFLFLVGVVLPFSLGKLRQDNRPTAPIYARIARRTLLLFALGLLCNGILRFDWSELRVTGVLQRIAICYGMAALIFLNTNRVLRGLVLTAILFGYWAILALIPAPESGRRADYTEATNLAGYLDRHYLPGKILPAYYGEGDNEGLLSTLPAIATTLLGVFAGEWLRSNRRPASKVLGLVLSGILSFLAGLLWSPFFPIIKNLWTSSFVLLTGGLSLLLLGLFYGLIDVLRWRRWAFPFVVIGVNAITIYVVPRFVDFKKVAEFFLAGTLRHAGDLEPVVLAGGILLAEWVFLWFLYRNRIFLRV